MKNKKITIGILIVTTLILIIWDIFVAVNSEKGDTISEVLLFFSTHPILPFAFGVLCGHWFWPQDKSILMGGTNGDDGKEIDK